MKPNQIYYFNNCVAEWKGIYQFEITNRENFKKQSLGFWNRLFANTIVIIQKVVGQLDITSSLKVPKAANGKIPFDYLDSIITISKFGVTLYKLKQKFIPQEDGYHVKLDGIQNMGPIPFLFKSKMNAFGKVHDDSQNVSYQIPFFGSDFKGEVSLSNECSTLTANFSNDWAKTYEVIHKV